MKRFGQVRKKLDKFDEIQTIFEKFEKFLKSLNNFGKVWTILDMIEQIWTCLNKYGEVWTNLDNIEQGDIQRYLEKFWNNPKILKNSKKFWRVLKYSEKF